MAKKTGKKSAPTKVESIRHKDKRKNIPTEELRDFVTEDEQAPKTMLYPRDPSLDPQLVWKGKDEQDRADLAVPVVPIYIQEKIHPQAIIDALPRIEQSGDRQLDLFADFNGLPAEFDQRVDFYHHNGHWSNRMILGDSLLVMTSLAEKEGLKGKVQTIYLDPPYGIKFGSNWQVSTRKRDVKDGKAEDATRQPEQIRAFRDTWTLGIHSYLAYLRDRLVVARDLLTETGSVFVQIGDENVHLVRCVLDEIFGSENFVSLITVKKTGGLRTDLLKNVTDYLIWYAKGVKCVKYRQLFREIAAGVGRTTGARYDQLESPDGKIRRPLLRAEKDDPSNIPPDWRPFQLVSLSSSGSTASCIYRYEFGGKVYKPSGESSWKTTREGMNRLANASRLVGTGGSLRILRYLSDFPAFELSNVWEDIAVGADKIYVVQTSDSAIQRCLLMTTDPGDLVLDPTCGSGTTAYVAEQWGRRWITCDNSRVALALARTRMMAAKYPYYLLADSPEGIKKEAEITGRMPVARGILPVPAHSSEPPSIDLGPVRLPGRGKDGAGVEIHVRHGAYLPHWTCEGGIYAVTFRLADSLPQSVLAGWLRERDDILQRAAAGKRTLTAAEIQRLADLHSERVETFLDQGLGECHFKEEAAAKIMRDALLHFDGKRYDLVAWCVMPNHVHAVVHPRLGFDLPEICHSWKSFTANEINRLLERKGTFWQPEPYDHLIRDEEDYRHAVDYVLANPAVAGLQNWTWVGRGAGFTPVSDAVFGAPTTGLCAVGRSAGTGLGDAHGQDGHGTADIRKGFVYKRVPHVTLKSIANNPDIKEGMTRQQIDAAIAKHAETETLYDQPYEDNKRVRVCGPFSVESLSPHRTISATEKKLRSEVGKNGLEMQIIGPDDFGHLVLENLRKAGVQNTRKAERLKFDSLDPYAGEWIHGQGTYSEAGGAAKRVAICIGPEHGTVGATLIKEAAKEAVKGVGFDMLIVCGFAFDPSVSEEAKRYGKLVVLPTKMNPDLAMGDELLKKTGAGNLFMVFGEPDVVIRKVDPQIPRMNADFKKDKSAKSVKSADTMLVVEIKGLDVYDPTTGQIRSASTDDIACWFIDTDYNGESFFVRHAYFTGADEPYDKLKRALRADIDEAAWSGLYSTISRPFDRPAAGKIAVKVINHYGDEVQKVFDV